jgi:ferredoxin-NADP reductase
MLEAAVISPETLCFVCGPDALVHDVPGMLRDIGVPEERIRVEEWAFRAP